MRPRAKSIALSIAFIAFAGISAALFQGYLTPEMLLYFASLKWCF